MANETMTNEQIAAEFEELFGGGKDPDEDETSDDEELETTGEENPEDSTDGESSDEDSDKDDNDEDEEQKEDKEEDVSDVKEKSSAPDKKAKQNYAFAELRNQNKKNEQFIRSLGKLVGFDDKATIDDIQSKIKEVLIEKEAKDKNISIELAKRLDQAEEVLQENSRIKLENKVTGDFSDLIDKYGLESDDVSEFTNHLINSGKNPMLDANVDIEYEYLKLHHQDLVDKAVADALAKEAARKDKVQQKAASPAPNGPSDKDEKKIGSVKDLDDLFAGIDL